MKLNDITALERISFFCGLEFIPKRTQWKGFDFITNLIRINEYSYRGGLVHMPNTDRRNLADLTIIDKQNISIDFYFIEPRIKEEIQNHVGSLRLLKNQTKTFR